ncbi:MAG TPA: ECF transporter S component [Nitrososphaerales archaeon]|nr:ECF transporter S component [Nitrososphaerales archaeon]
MEKARFDSVSVAGIAVFGALATLLAAVSQSLGLNFPLVPYLQFDLAEVAIIMAFFIFGPLPAVASSVVEFAALLVFGQNVPVGPVLKLFALLSTIGGMWVGSRISFRLRTPTLLKVVVVSAVFGSIIRAVVMTIPNYYIIVFLYSLQGVEGLVKSAFASAGVSLTDANALALILGFTALFNVAQLAIVIGLSYLVLRVPPVSNMKVGGRPPWFVSVTSGRAKAEGGKQ